MLPPTLHPDWMDVFDICRRISADSAAWDETNAFTEALNELRREKCATRQSHQRDLAKELPEFLEKWKPLIGRTLPPGADTWTTNVADEVQAELARKALQILDTALVEAETAARTLDQAPYKERRALRVRQTEAQDRIEAASDELTGLLGGKNPSSLVEPSPQPVETTESALPSDVEPPILPPPEEKTSAVTLLPEVAAPSHEEPPASPPIQPVSNRLFLHWLCPSNLLSRLNKSLRQPLTCSCPRNWTAMTRFVDATGSSQTGAAPWPLGRRRL